MQERGIISRLNALAMQPFNQKGDLLQWSLFAVVIVTIAFAWSRVLKHISE